MGLLVNWAGLDGVGQEWQEECSSLSKMPGPYAGVEPAWDTH